MMPIPDDPIISCMERTGNPPWYDDDYAVYEPEDDDEDGEDDDQTQTALIAITTLPEIKENLHALRERWEQKAKDAAAIVCTDESIQSIKTMRAEMRKEYDDADTQRKAVKERYMAAWNDVEATWKECVSDPFKRADASYKATVDGFEEELKSKCREDLQSYFDELCAADGVDFLTFEQAMALGEMKISMADAKSKNAKKLKYGLAEVVSNVAETARQIDGMDDAAEIMAEYKISFDVGHAIATVQGRKKRVESEREAAEARRSPQERVREAERRVDASMPPERIKATQDAERRFERFSFTVKNATRNQLIKIREFLKQEGIEYE